MVACWPNAVHQHLTFGPWSLSKHINAHRNCVFWPFIAVTKYTWETWSRYKSFLHISNDKKITHWMECLGYNKTHSYKLTSWPPSISSQMLQQMDGKVFLPSGVSLEPIHSSLTDKEIMDGFVGKILRGWGKACNDARRQGDAAW